MLNIFKKPFEKELLEDWAKVSIELAKIAFLAIPVVIYSQESFSFKLSNSLLLAFMTYCGIVAQRYFRKKQKEA